MDDAAWTSAYRAAVAAGTADAFRPLFRDIAVTARMGALPGLRATQTTVGTTQKKMKPYCRTCSSAMNG